MFQRVGAVSGNIRARGKQASKEASSKAREAVYLQGSGKRSFL